MNDDEFFKLDMGKVKWGDYESEDERDPASPERNKKSQSKTKNKVNSLGNANANTSTNTQATRDHDDRAPSSSGGRSARKNRRRGNHDDEGWGVDNTHSDGPQERPYQQPRKEGPAFEPAKRRIQKSHGFLRQVLHPPAFPSLCSYLVCEYIN